MANDIGAFLGTIIINSVIPVVFAFYLNHLLKKSTMMVETKKEDEKRQSFITLRSIAALCETSKAMCEALKSGKINGNIDNSLKKLNEISDEINEYVMEKATRE